MSASSDAELLKVINETIQVLKGFEGFTARWAPNMTVSFVRESTAVENALAKAQGVLAAIGTHFIREPLVFDPILEQVNQNEFDTWAEAHNEPSLTAMELHQVKRFLTTLAYGADGS